MKTTTDLQRQTLPPRLRPIYREVPRFIAASLIVMALTMTVITYLGMLVDYSKSAVIDCADVTLTRTMIVEADLARGLWVVDWRSDDYALHLEHVAKMYGARFAACVAARGAK